MSLARNAHLCWAAEGRQENEGKKGHSVHFAVGSNFERQGVCCALRLQALRINHWLVHSSGFLDLQLVPELGPLCGPLRFGFDFGSALQIEMTPFECLCYELYRYCTSISSGMIPTGVLELRR